MIAKISTIEKRFADLDFTLSEVFIWCVCDLIFESERESEGERERERECLEYLCGGSDNLLCLAFILHF
jgi:hypothetical protein